MIRSLYARSIAALGLTCLSLLISACGFHLKGQQSYAFKRLYIEASAQTSPAMIAHLKKMMAVQSRITLIRTPDKADAVLFLDATRNRRSASLGAHGATEEYALEIVVKYQLKDATGAILIAPDLLTLSRSMTYNNQYALAKAAESEQLYQDMEYDAVDQLLRRLASVQPIEAD